MERLKSRIKTEIAIAGSEEQAANRAKWWFSDHKKGNIKSFDLSALDGYLHPGKIHSFRYNPKTKKGLAYYDKNPIVISLGTKNTKNGNIDVGVNLNFIPRKARHYILDKIQQAYSAQYDRSIRSFTDHVPQPEEQTIIKLNYDYLKAMLNSAGFGFAIRTYIPDRRSKTYVLSNELWEKAAVIDIKDFEGISEQDLLRFYREYINK